MMNKFLSIGICAIACTALSVVAEPNFILKNKSPYFIEVKVEGKLNNKDKKPITQEFSMESGKDKVQEKALYIPATLDTITITWCNKPADADSCDGYLNYTGKWQFINSTKTKNDPGTTKYYIKFNGDGTEKALLPQEGNVFNRTAGLEKNYSLKGNVKNLKMIE